MASTFSSPESTILNWLNGVSASPPADITITTSMKALPQHESTIAQRPVKRLRSTDMDSGIGVVCDYATSQETPRPSKRLRGLDLTHHFSPSTSSINSASTVSISSHKSGRLSPVKQIQALEDLERPVVFCDLGSLEAESEQAHPGVITMHTAAQMLADGVGILEYNDADAFNASIAELPELDRTRLQYPMTKNPRRAYYGLTPAIDKVVSIVHAARALNSGAGGAEDEWNTHVQYPLLSLALETSQHSKALSIRSVKSARIDPAELCNKNLPGRIIDYVICLQPDSTMSQAYKSLRPLAANTVKSWNHITRLQNLPIAINIETKGPMKSWTDGKPQIGIWIDAWLRRCELLWEDSMTSAAILDKDWPAIPVPISQGHEWHLLIVTKTNKRLVISEQIIIGSTRNCFDALKVVAVLHWVIDWAERVWRPWFMFLVAGSDG